MTVGVEARPRAPRLDWSGLLALDKPSGITSHDAVERVRRRLRTPGAGHLGTLDPGASGLLLVAIGAATRCTTVWQGGVKTYEATVRFGITTGTQDLQGEVLAERPVSGLNEAAVRAAARRLTGEFLQLPPMVSALKVDGERLYRLARRGETVERAPRPVHVMEWTWLAFALPEATFRVRCSGGTYVRTLAHDLGEALGCGGALAALRRLRSEPWGLERALAWRDLDALTPTEALARAGIPLDEALRILPAATLDEAAVGAIGHGGRPAIDADNPADLPLLAGPRSVVLRARDGRALGLGEIVSDPARPGERVACPHVVFPWAVRTGRW